MKAHFTWGWIGWLLLIFYLNIPLSNLKAGKVNALERLTPPTGVVADDMRQATVQITLLKWAEDKSASADQKTVVTLLDKGLGTLLAYEGEALLISHNHWSQLNSTVVPDLVRFYDADGSFLLEIAGAAFSKLMLFHDGGTLIMRAPPRLAAQLSSTATVGDIAALKPDTIVYLAQRQGNESNRVVVKAAVVVTIVSHNNIPLLVLHSLNGESIEPGDSGGGVWLEDGRFVGNLWMTVVKVKKSWWPTYLSEKTTAYSYAAGFGDDLSSLVSLILQPQTLPPIQTNGPS